MFFVVGFQINNIERNPYILFYLFIEVAGRDPPMILRAAVRMFLTYVHELRRCSSGEQIK